MSASPSGLPNGQNPPPKGLPPLRRRPRAADPLVARKKPKPKTQISKPPAPGNGVPAEAGGPGSTNPLANKDAEKKLMEFNAARKRNGGWTDPPPPPEAKYRDFPLILTKRALKDGRRFHVMKLSNAKGAIVEQDIDPTNQNEFTRPVSLHRRDPRQPPPGRAVKEEPPTPPPVDDDDAEAERIAQQKAERDAQRAIDMAQIAPTVKEAAQKRPSQQKKKKERSLQVWMNKRNANRSKETELHYEEALPWHLEDADGKNVWVGSYTRQLSEVNVAFVIDGSGFRMVPLEKFYRFTPKPNFQSFSVEEAENMMNKKVVPSRWAMRDLEKKKAEEEYELSRMTLGGRARVKQESSTYRSAPRSEKIEQNDIDMEGDEFQDDDENTGLEPDNDDEAKDARDRVRREQLGANLFGDADEAAVEKEEADVMMAELKRKLDGKKLRKALTKREGQEEYIGFRSDEDDENLGDSSSEDEEEEAADEEKKDDDSKIKVEPKDKTASGAASKGNTTPSGKPKPADIAKKGKSLKRPGSPNLSESSGNESSRKRMKKVTNAGSVRGSRSSTPVPGQPRPKGKGGAASDGEATAGEMSDGGPRRKQKIKLVGSGAKGTPAGSRAGSPVPSQGLAPGSNTVSPVKGGPSTPRASTKTGVVEASEIEAALRAAPEGMNIGALLRLFGTRVGVESHQMPRKDWIKLVKETAVFGDDKLLRLKPKEE